MLDSNPRPGLFPNIKEYLNEESTLAMIDDGANSNIRAFYILSHTHIHMFFKAVNLFEEAIQTMKNIFFSTTKK